MVTVLWDTRVKPEAAAEGYALIRRIWRDMEHFAGYVSHRLLQEEDEAGHFVVVSEWESRAAADASREQYAQAEPVRLLMPLLAVPRIRWVLSEVP